MKDIKDISNEEICKILRELSIFYEIKDIEFKSRAIDKALHNIEALDKNLKDIYLEKGIDGLKEIPGIGQGIAERIEEILKTGTLLEYEKYKKEIPIDIENLIKIEGVGPKTIAALWQRLKIKNVDELEKAAKEHKICKLERFGEKSEQKILKGIEFYKSSGQRFLLGFIEPTVLEIKEYLQGFKEVKKIEIAGSFRRRKETIGDVDILVVSNEPEKVVEKFLKMKNIAYVYAKGDTKCSIKLENGLDVDLRIVEEKSFGAALMYFTGSKEHNIELRQIAIKKGYKLNEYGLFKDEKFIAGKTEEEVYAKLGLEWIPPELREAKGEIVAAQKGELPKLIDYDDLKGDLQVQTNWTDGSNSIEEMVKAAIEMNLEYIAITDHTKSLAMTGGLDEKEILKQIEEIKKLNEKYKGKIKILTGAEVNILPDGSLDIKDEILEKLDFVGASVHSHFNLDRNKQTKRIIKAIENPNVDCIFHLTTRVINRRKEIDIDLDTIFKLAAKTRTLLEINAYPDRLDIKDVYILEAKKNGVKFVIDSDAHSKMHFKFLKYGISQARRGWCEKGDIANAWPLEKFLKFKK